MRAGRTLTGMNEDAGREQRVVEESSDAKPKRRWDWSMNLWGNRLGYSIAAGFLVNVAAHTRTLGTVIAVVLFVITTAIVTTRRR